MSAISPIVTCSTIYEYRTPDGRIQPLVYTRLATREERQRIIDSERTPEFYRKQQKSYLDDSDCYDAGVSGNE